MHCISNVLRQVISQPLHPIVEYWLIFFFCCRKNKIHVTHQLFIQDKLSCKKCYVKAIRKIRWMKKKLILSAYAINFRVKVQWTDEKFIIILLFEHREGLNNYICEPDYVSAKQHVYVLNVNWRLYNAWHKVRDSLSGNSFKLLGNGAACTEMNPRDLLISDRSTVFLTTLSRGLKPILIFQAIILVQQIEYQAKLLYNLVILPRLLNPINAVFIGTRRVGQTCKVGRISSRTACPTLLHATA